MKPRTETNTRRQTRTLLGTLHAVVVCTLFLATWGCGGGGGGGGGGAALGVKGAATLAFTGNTDGTISILEVAPDGVLTQLGFVDVSPFAIREVQVHSNGRFLFAVAGDTLFAFAIEESTLELINVEGIGGDADELVIGSSGRFGYVGRSGGQPALVTFSIDRNSGEVDVIDTIATTNEPTSLEMDPAGKLLFLLSGTQIQAFEIANDGLPMLSAFTTPAEMPVGQTLSSDGMYLYVTTDTDALYSFDVASDGVLTLNSSLMNLGSPYSDLREPLLSDDEEFLYALNLSATTVVTLSIDFDSGALIGTVGNPQSTRGRGRSAELSGDGTQLYVGQEDSGITVFDLLSGQPSYSGGRMRVRSDVSALAVRLGQGAPSGGASLLYVPNASDATIVAFQVMNDGQLNEQAATPTGDGPRQLAFHPNGRYAYGLSRNSADVETFSVNAANGMLTSLDVKSLASANPEQDLIRITVDPTGRFLYVLDGKINFGNTGIVHLLRLGDDGIPTGAIEDRSSGGFNPEAFVIAPNGRYMYVANSYGDRITVFEIDRNQGLLTQKFSYVGFDRPTNMVMHPDGYSLYVVIENEESVARFRVEETGALTGATQYQKPSPEDTIDIALHPDRRRLYVSDFDNSIATFEITPVGTLNYAGEVTAGLANGLAVTPDGRNLYSTSSQTIREFSIDELNGMLTLEGLLDVPGQAASARPTVR